MQQQNDDLEDHKDAKKPPYWKRCSVWVHSFLLAWAGLFASLVSWFGNVYMPGNCWLTCLTVLLAGSTLLPARARSGLRPANRLPVLINRQLQQLLHPVASLLFPGLHSR